MLEFKKEAPMKLVFAALILASCAPLPAQITTATLAQNSERIQQARQQAGQRLEAAQRELDSARAYQAYVAGMADMAAVISEQATSGTAAAAPKKARK
jgi:hypothetical protein